MIFQGLFFQYIGARLDQYIPIMISTIITDADIVAIRSFSFLMNEHGKNIPKKIIAPHITDVSKCQIIIIINRVILQLALILAYRPLYLQTHILINS